MCHYIRETSSKLPFSANTKTFIYTHKYYYIGFALVCIGIEFVGKCLDQAEQDWKKGRAVSQKRISRTRLNRRCRLYTDPTARFFTSSFGAALHTGCCPAQR
jgi:hypothetical protein